MYAITLHQPWAWAIAYAGKRIENRTWHPPMWIIGKQIAIHAGKKLDIEAAEGLYQCGIDIPTTFTTGAAECIVTVKGWINSIDKTHSQYRWFHGPIGWVLDEVIPITPIDCRGRQKVWVLPRDVESQVMAQLKNKIPG